MSKIKLPHASGNSMSIGAPATNPSGDLELKLPATIGTAGQVLKNSDTAGTLEFGPPPRPYRNLLINGAMQVAQRGTSITAEGYVCDRWRVGYTGLDEAPTTTQHALTSSDTGPWAKGFRYSSHIQNGNQTSGAGASDYLFLSYRMEAQDLANSGWDYTSASSYITLSFWVKSSVAQNFYGYLRSQDGTGQLYCFETGSLSANTWTKITKKIPGNSNIQVDNNNDIGLEIQFAQWWGGTYTNNNSLNTWATFDTNNRTPDQTSTWYTTNDATFEITGIQLEVGDVATDFEHKSYGDELVRCQRYYYRWTAGTADRYVWMGQSYSTGATFGIIKDLPVTMRAVPTSTVSGTFTPYGDDGSTSGHSAFSSTAINQNNVDHIGTGGWAGASGIGAGGRAVVVKVGEAAGYIDASAEL